MCDQCAFIIKGLTADHCCCIDPSIVVTFYATLGEDAVAFGLNETGVTHLVTSADLLENKLKVSPMLVDVKVI